MREFIPTLLSLFVIFGVVILISRKFKISSRYERKPRQLNTWSSLDKGIDPTEGDDNPRVLQ